MEIKVLDKGFVRLVDHMGSDSAIVQAARVSYGEGTKKVNEDVGLINYLMKHKHMSPFEMCELKFHIKLPIFVARQWIRHRTANVNEISGRYSELKEEYYMPSHVYKQASKNKQGSSDETIEEGEYWLDQVNTQCGASFGVYKAGLSLGVAREEARIGLPINTYTEWYWKIDLRNLLHFLRLRLDSHAQYEIREYAKAIKDIVKQLFPIAWQAFKEHEYYAVTFSRREMAYLKRNIDSKHKPIEWGDKNWKEFLEKVGKAEQPPTITVDPAFEPSPNFPALSYPKIPDQIDIINIFNKEND